MTAGNFLLLANNLGKEVATHISTRQATRNKLSSPLDGKPSNYLSTAANEAVVFQSPSLP